MNLKRSKIHLNWKIIRSYAHLSSMAYDDKTYIEDIDNYTYGWKYIGLVENKKWNSRAFVATNHKHKIIVISFKGSDSLDNFLTDSKISFKKFDKFHEGYNDEVEIHTGFYDYTNSLIELHLNELVFKAMKDLNAIEDDVNFITRFVVTGHSLGGAAATIYAHHLYHYLFQNHYRRKTKILLYTYGSPRVGNQHFADTINKEIGINNIFTIQFNNDPITTIPNKCFYSHVGTLFRCPDKNSYEIVCNTYPSDVAECGQWSLISRLYKDGKDHLLEYGYETIGLSESQLKNQKLRHYQEKPSWSIWLFDKISEKLGFEDLN